MSQPQPDGDTCSEALLLNKALEWIESGYEVALATVISTWGSSPRPVGSQLIIRDDNLFEGSVSGGCIEGEVVAAALSVIRDENVKTLEFGIADAAAWEVGLACGGQVKVFVQKITGNLKQVLSDLKLTLQQKRATAVLIDLSSGRTQLKENRDHASEDLARCFADDESGLITFDGNENIFAHILNPPLRMFIIGAVHIAQILSSMATQTGYEVVVIDPRDTWAENARFPGVTIDKRWPSTALEELSPNSRTAVVTLCHDPKLDDPALLVALNSDAFYIGSLGSRKTHGKRIERLKLEGVSDELLNRIKAPVGLNIGARTTAEIALSIMGQVTETLRRPK